MLEKDAGRTAHRKFAASSAIETGLSQINDRNRARGSSEHSYGSPTLRFAWRSFKWSRRLGLLPRNRDRYRLPQCWEIRSGSIGR